MRSAPSHFVFDKSRTAQQSEAAISRRCMLGRVRPESCCSFVRTGAAFRITGLISVLCTYTCAVDAFVGVKYPRSSMDSLQPTMLEQSMVMRFRIREDGVGFGSMLASANNDQLAPCIHLHRTEHLPTTCFVGGTVLLLVRKDKNSWILTLFAGFVCFVGF